ncbi:MAG: ion transporter [Nanoarchaeota archaeon]|nr:ion transporter [Nanoarchaeota archaeon]
MKTEKAHPAHPPDGWIKRMSFRQKLRNYLEECDTPFGRFLDFFTAFLTIAICILFVIGTYAISSQLKETLWVIENIIVAFFIVEYAARFYAAEKRFKHALGFYSIIDFLSILPTILLFFFGTSNIQFMTIMRVFRILRIFRILRNISDTKFFFGKTTAHILNVIQLVTTIFIIFFVSASTFWIVESPINPNVKNFTDSFYFTTVVLATVGFGDIVPVSQLGRLVTVLIVISGIIFIPWQASKLIKEWVRMSSKKRVVCKKCGLKYHDDDATHCKHCGKMIYQEKSGMD